MSENIVPFKNSAKILIHSIFLHSLVLTIIWLYAIEYPSVFRLMDNFHSLNQNIKIISILIISVIGTDFLLNAYFFLLSNRFMDENKYSWKLIFFILLYSLLGRIIVGLIIFYQFANYTGYVNVLYIIGIFILCLLLIISPLYLILKSVSYFLIMRIEVPAEEKLKLSIIKIINLFLSILTSMIIITPMIAVLVYHSWSQGYSNLEK